MYVFVLYFVCTYVSALFCICLYVSVSVYICMDYALGHNYAPGGCSIYTWDWPSCICLYMHVSVCIGLYHDIWVYIYACICMYMIISYCICMYCAYQHAGNQWKRQNGHLQMMGCPPIFLYITVSRGPLIWVATQLEMRYNLNSYWYADFILSVFFTDTYRHIQTYTDTYRHIQTHTDTYRHIYHDTYTYCHIHAI